jgi:MFS family permease
MQWDLVTPCPRPYVFLDLVLTATRTLMDVQSVGIGAMAMTPIIGSLSDNYGRKPLLTITCAANILPLCKIPFILLFRSAYYSNVALMYKGYSFLNRFSDRLFFLRQEEAKFILHESIDGIVLNIFRLF